MKKVLLTLGAIGGADSKAEIMASFHAFAHTLMLADNTPLVGVEPTEGQSRLLEATPWGAGLICSYQVIPEAFGGMEVNRIENYTTNTFGIKGVIIGEDAEVEKSVQLKTTNIVREGDYVAGFIFERDFSLIDEELYDWIVYPAHAPSFHLSTPSDNNAQGYVFAGYAQESDSKESNGFKNSLVSGLFQDGTAMNYKPAICIPQKHISSILQTLSNVG